MKWLIFVALSSFQTSAQDSTSQIVSANDSSLTPNTESIGFILNDTALFANSINQISFRKRFHSARRLLKRFNPERNQHNLSLASINITEGVKAVYIEGSSKNYATDLILLYKEEKAAIIHLSSHGAKLYGFKSLKDKHSFLQVNWRSITFSDVEDVYYLSYSCSEDSENFEQLTISQLFKLIDEPESIQHIQLPNEPERVEQIQLR